MKRIITLTLCLTALFALVCYIGTHGMNQTVAYLGLGLLGLTPLGIVKTDGNDAVMEEREFQDTVIKGLEAMDKRSGETGTKVDKLVQNYEQLTGETKKAFEEVTALKKNANDQQANFTALERKIGELQTHLRREMRMAYGDPIQRISASDELRLRFNAAIRMAVANPGGDMINLVRRHFPGDFVKRALGEDSSPGSTLIDDQLAREIYDTLSMYGIWNTFRVIRLGTKQTKFPVKTARPVANFVLTEGGTISDDTNKAGTSVTLEAEVIGVLLNVSLQLLQDAEVDITADVLEDFAEAFAYRLDWAATQADGGSDATDGGMTGIFGGGGTAAAAASGNTSVETTDFEDWTKCLLTVDPAVLNRAARWWMHPQILVRALSVKDSNGRPIFLTATEAPTRGGIGSILGYPVTPGMVCPTTNSASAKVAVFGDGAGQVVGVRQDFEFAASDHHTWDTFQRSFRGVGRAGTKIRRSQAFAVLTLAAS